MIKEFDRKKPKFQQNRGCRRSYSQAYTASFLGSPLQPMNKLRTTCTFIPFARLIYTARYERSNGQFFGEKLLFKLQWRQVAQRRMKALRIRKEISVTT
jgi:hypothetical protein